MISQKYFPILFALSLVLLIGCNKKSTEPEHKNSLPNADYSAKKATEAPVINGLADDACWESVDWAGFDYLWLGADVPESDFSGKFKIVWDENRLYFLVEIKDQMLADNRPDWRDQCWEDDCLEIFMDEDKSGGDHQNTDQAFAYHIGMDYHAYDTGRDLQDHMDVVLKSIGNTHIWEVGLDIYPATYNHDLPLNLNPKVELKVNKLIGFAIAYCDSDETGNRESFYGTNFIPGEDKNVAWRDASAFGSLLLVE